MWKALGIVGLLLGIAMTVVEFATHDLMCKYDMNPICFFWALKWAFLGFMWYLGATMDDKDGHGKK